MKHTAACNAARGGPNHWPQIPPTIQLRDDEGQVRHEPNPQAEAVFACPHHAHDAYRAIWGRSNAD